MEIYCIEIERQQKENLFYIGKSSRNSDIRFREHLNGATQLVDKCIKKYGKDATKLHILCKDVESDEELDRLEILYIQLFESYVGLEKGGLNVTRGGGGARTIEIDKDELQAAANEGLSRTELCIRFGRISSDALAGWMKAYGIKLKTVSASKAPSALLKELVSEGKSVVEISKAIGIADSTLRKFLKENGLYAVKKKNSLTTDQQVEEIRELTEAGKSVREIERLTGIHRATVHANQKRLGIKPHGSKKGGGSSRYGSVTVTSELVSKVNELRAAGLSYDAIAREAGCSPKTAHRIITTPQNYIQED